MYLYVVMSEDGDELTSIALMPSTRGRPAKNHDEVEVNDLSFYIAVIDESQLATIPLTPEELKNAVANGSVPTMSFNEVNDRFNDYELVERLTQSFVNMWLSLPAEFNERLAALNGSEYKQIAAAIQGLADALRSVSHSNMAEIIQRNRRALNGVLSANPYGCGWWHKDPTARPIVTTTNSEIRVMQPEETLDEKAEKAEKMTATNESFGFGKLAGDKPDLKIATDHEREAAAANGVFFPKPDDTYIINDQVAQLFKILQISRRNCPQNVRLLGPHGCGKTELAIQFAARLNMPLLIMDCANLREARDWFGYKGAKDGTVYWHESQFVRAVTAGNHVILLDELNRANPHLLNTLMPLLDARRFTYLEEKGDKICVGPGTVFFASMNEGAGYTGTSSLDRAIRDRFPRVIEMSYLAEKDEIKLLTQRVGISEELATRLVGMANKIRQDSTGLSATLTESLSTRQLIAAAHDFAIGGVDTLTFTISNHFSPDGDDESERVRVQSIIQGKFGDMLAAKAAKAGAKGA